VIFFIFVFAAKALSRKDKIKFEELTDYFTCSLLESLQANLPFFENADTFKI